MKNYYTTHTRSITFGVAIQRKREGWDINSPPAVNTIPRRNKVCGVVCCVGSGIRAKVLRRMYEHVKDLLHRKGICGHMMVEKGIQAGGSSKFHVYSWLMSETLKFGFFCLSLSLSSLLRPTEASPRPRTPPSVHGLACFLGQQH